MQPSLQGFSPSPRMVSVERWSLAVVPVAFMALASWLMGAKGPYWLGPNLDPDYHYLLNALLLATGRSPAFVDHPGTTPQLIFALLLWIPHVGATRPQVVRAVLLRPEPHLFVLQWALIMAMAAVLWKIGQLTLQATRGVGWALALQALPLVSPTLLRESLCVKPEPFLVMIGLLLGTTIVASALRGGAAPGLGPSVLLGLLSGLALTTKITALPLCVAPLVALPGARRRAVFVATLTATAALVLFAASPHLGRLLDLLRGIAAGAGRYGGGAPADPQGKGAALLRLLAQAPLFTGALLISGVSALATLRRKRAAASSPCDPALAALAAALVVQALLVASHPFEARYLIPGLAVAPPAVLVSLFALKPAARTWLDRPRRAAAVLAALGAAAVLSAVVTHRQLAADQRAAQDLDALLAGRFASTPVVDFYRASTPRFALYFGNEWARREFGPELDLLHPDDSFYNVWSPSFVSFSGPLAVESVATSHEMLLRGATFDVLPMLRSRPEFRLPVIEGPVDALYRIRLRRDLPLAFGEYVASGLGRAVAVGPAGVLARPMTATSLSLVYVAGASPLVELVGTAINLSGGSAVRLSLTADGLAAGEITIPPRTAAPTHDFRVRVRVPVAEGARSLRLTLAPESRTGPRPAIAYTSLRLVPRAEGPATAGAGPERLESGTLLGSAEQGPSDAPAREPRAALPRREGDVRTFQVAFHQAQEGRARRQAREDLHQDHPGDVDRGPHRRR